jgi:hypothetical protein
MDVIHDDNMGTWAFWALAIGWAGKGGGVIGGRYGMKDLIPVDTVLPRSKGKEYDEMRDIAL